MATSSAANSERDDARGDALLEPVPASTPPTAGSPTSSAVADVDVAVGALGERRRRGDEDDRGQRRARSPRARRRPSQRIEQRHDDRAAADAEQAAEQPRRGPDRRELQRPAAAAWRGILGARARGRHRSPRRSRRCAPTRRARRVLLDVDGTLAPIVRHADDAHVPEPTRAPLIAVAKRYGLVACVSGRRAAIARRIVSLGSIAYVGNHGAELLRGGADERRGRPRRRRVGAPRAAPSRASAATDELHRLRVRARGQGRRSPPSTGAARRDEARGRGRRARARRPTPRRARPRRALGPQGARGPPARRRSTRAAGVRAPAARAPTSTPALYAGDDLTDLDAFRGAARRSSTTGGCARAVCVGVALGRDAGRARARGRRARRRPARRARAARGAAGLSAGVRFVDFLKATVLLSAGAATMLAAVTRGRRRATTTTELVLVAAGWWVVAARDRRCGSGAAREPTAADRAAAGRRARRRRCCPSTRPGRDAAQPPVAAAAAARSPPARWRSSLPQVPGDRGRLRDHLGAGAGAARRRR